LSGQIVARSKRLASNDFFERSLVESGQSDGEVREDRSLPLASMISNLALIPVNLAAADSNLECPNSNLRPTQPNPFSPLELIY
jgi:hypothetical protein